MLRQPRQSPTEAPTEAPTDSNNCPPTEPPTDLRQAPTDLRQLRQLRQPRLRAGAERFCSKSRFPPLGADASRLLCARATPIRLDRSRETRPVAPPTPTRNVLWISRGPAFGLWRPGGLSDARVIREGPTCLLYTSPSPRDKRQSRMPSSA